MPLQDHPPRPLPPVSSLSVFTKPLPSDNFFASAAASFHPRPYAPNPLSSDFASRPLQPRPTRAHDALAIPPAGMDPLPSDPNVIFIHPPFKTFPNSHLHPDGLTYPLMADNPEWFLDPHDFVSQNNPNAHAVPYPPYLEPPRGWCPAKKKDLKERGMDGWPEGEEPRLRCTFCRRTYAGVNAKSMWRRHVFEKHKIAMSNRRDGNDRPRGRGSGKENRQADNRHRDDHLTLDKVVNMDVNPQTDPQNVSHKSRFRSLLPAEELKSHRRDRAKAKEKMAPPAAPSEVVEGDQNKPIQDQKSVPPISPPLTPQPSSGSASAIDSTDADASDKTNPGSPTPIPPAVPPSPYDPLLTPSFRHSPPRLPSDQPWRFPSPSHPLHSQTRELTLSMLIRDSSSPLIKGSAFLGASPFIAQRSPMSSPRAGKYINELDTPAGSSRLGGSSNRKRLLRGHLPSPVSGRLGGEIGKYRIEASPLSRTPSTSIRGHKKSISELTDDFFSSPRIPLYSSEFLSDPFVAMYNASAWTPLKNAISNSSVRNTPSKAILEAESPVLRNRSISSGIGLGIGLLEPFTLPKDDACSMESESDFNKLYPSLTEDEKGDGSSSDSDGKEDALSDGESSPPLKRRKTSVSSN
ncbi:hypothetical protein BDQ17DRAFT_1268932 [Cyathus striatus]|nr:hypothetical protein BDQ17DRAFT_1268932 [Cyathus striatus]